MRHMRALLWSLFCEAAVADLRQLERAVVQAAKRWRSVWAGQPVPIEYGSFDGLFRAVDNLVRAEAKIKGAKRR